MPGATVDAQGQPIPEQYQVGAEELANLSAKLIEHLKIRTMPIGMTLVGVYPLKTTSAAKKPLWTTPPDGCGVRNAKDRRPLPSHAPSCRGETA